MQIKAPLSGLCTRLFLQKQNTPGLQGAFVPYRCAPWTRIFSLGKLPRLIEYGALNWEEAYSLLQMMDNLLNGIWSEASSVQAQRPAGPPMP
ncbi:MAG: hypothetical protein EP302_09980 [Bacteroidetes bacterium]|nr:MAG: hypothetical protein EP302_09980 [Bacteroidota bacterium]